MLKRTRSLLWAGVGLATVGGCATVDPRPDFQRASRQITAATGVENVYRPEDDDRVSSQVAELLRNGLTADEAVQISLLNNPGLQASFAALGMARADVVQAGLFSNPFVGVSAKFPDGGGLANIEASVAQNIAELWQIPVRKRAAQRSLDRAILELARVAVSLAADTKGAYYAAVGADERHRIAQENLTIAQRLLELALTRQEAGAASELDVNLSRSVAIQADIEVEQARLASAEARRALATILGLVGNADALVLTDSLPDDFPEMADASSLVELAKGMRLDLRAAREAVAVARARWEAQRRLVFPAVEVSLKLEREDRRSQGGRNLLADTARASIANGGWTAPEIQPRSERRGEGGQATSIGPGLGIELPIFDQNQAPIAKAQYALQQAHKTLDAVDRAVTQQVRSAVDRALTAWRLMDKFRDQSIPLAQSNLELSREAYRAGRASLLSVLEAQRLFLETRNGYVTAAQSAAAAVPELERTIGLPFSALMAAVISGPAPGTEAEKDVEP